MEPEPGEGLDVFLRRAAQVAALGAAVGAAVGAARAARAESQDDDERDSSEREEGNDERVQPQEQEEPRAEREPEPPEQEENEEEPGQQHPRQSAQEEEAPDERPEEDESGSAEPRRESPDGQVTGEAASVIRRALTQLEQLTGREPEGVLGFRRDDEGWLVTVEVVELPRVPSSTDVLATYDVVLDDEGDVREYRRTGRYIRGRAEPGE